MNLEQLNKSQIVLLTLLVSFVTSIATGIVSVTLMEQAPPAITQTVNRIVERTIEKVVPAEGQVASAATVTEKVTVYESDQVASAVEKSAPIAVRLFGRGRDQNGADIEVFLGLGVVAASDGLIFADASMMTDDANITVLRHDGVRVPAKVVSRDVTGIVRLQAASTTQVEKDGKTETQTLAWTPATFVKSDARLGESVVVLAGQSSLKIANGIVTALPAGAGADSHTIETNILSTSYTVGSPLITVNGEVLGIATAGSRAVSGGFLASSFVLSYNTTTQNE